MNALLKALCSRRRPERRDVNRDGRALSASDRRGYADRRSDPEWRHVWLRARVCQALRD